jgi:hypothetical protein
MKRDRLVSLEGAIEKADSESSRVFPVEMGSRAESDEELRSVGVGSRVGHRQDTSAGEAKLGVLREGRRSANSQQGVALSSSYSRETSMILLTISSSKLDP